ncbi:hypothetical protein PMI30_05164 [Pseudomonas sp. GM50]|uniref:hypothetical protein n=1 Tax=Pseudomonas sp. GM50 TaxID=1144332 RepID=UPI0002709100|nr:hypothetical protein [Pseudomonas sp. GM50]EJM61574.1 hypothetical protein PMI30_05164 [Pseudomonas sp. GM50]
MSIATSLIPLASALLGGAIGVWITISRTQYSAYSADFSKRVEQILALIDRKAESSCRFWIDDNSDKLYTDEAYLIGLKSSLTVCVDALNKDYTGFNKTRILSALTEFNKSCTGYNFPNKGLPENIKPPVAEILKTAEILKCEIFKARKKNYRWLYSAR